MTVKDVINAIMDVREVWLDAQGTEVKINHRNETEIFVWGDFIVDRIYMHEDNVVSLRLAMDFRKAGASS